MKSWELTCGYGRDEAGEPTHKYYVTIYEQPAWRVLLGPFLYWFDLHKPRWMEPGNGRPTSIDHDDGTCTFLWRLRLECWLAFDFHHKDRKIVETLDAAARDPKTWKIIKNGPAD